MSTITITFGDQAENHRGMQKIGKEAINGYSRKDLQMAKEKFEKSGYKCILYNLNEYLEEKADDACVLVIKKGVECFLGKGQATVKELHSELSAFDWDKKVLMYGKVVNKLARHNLCFGDESQDPQYQRGKGTIIPWKQAPLLSKVRQNLGKYLPEGQELVAEGNHYYDISKCGVRFHGDEERKRVVGLRLSYGYCPPLHYQWFQQSKPIGKRAIIELDNGDAYVMSQKASGNDEKKRIIPTLRHATGAAKYTTL